VLDLKIQKDQQEKNNLYSVVEDIYKAKYANEPNIIDTINKESSLNPKNFIGKSFDFQDPRTH
jgi:hypothetical protein